MFGIRLRLWVLKVLVTLLVVFGLVALTKLFSLISKKSTRVVAIISLVVLLLISSPVWFILGVLFYTKTESVVTKDGVKYVAEQEEFDNVIVRYYEYRDFLTCGTRVRFKSSSTVGDPTDYMIVYDDKGKELETYYRNGSHYFFQGLNDEYIFKVKEPSGESTVKVKITDLAHYDYGIAYSIDIEGDVPEDMSHIATFMISDSTYLLPDHDGKSVPTKEEFKEKGVNIKLWSQDSEGVDGLEITAVHNSKEDDHAQWYISSPLTKDGYYASYVWTYDKGLTSFRAGYENKGDLISIYR